MFLHTDICNDLFFVRVFLQYCWYLEDIDCLRGLVVRIPDYRSKGPAFDSWSYQIFREVVSLEQAPLNLVRITEELLE
jgi:hypothetical protein